MQKFSLSIHLSHIVSHDIAHVKRIAKGTYYVVKYDSCLAILKYIEHGATVVVLDWFHVTYIAKLL